MIFRTEYYRWKKMKHQWPWHGKSRIDDLGYDDMAGWCLVGSNGETTEIQSKSEMRPTSITMITSTIIRKQTCNIDPTPSAPSLHQKQLRRSQIDGLSNDAMKFFLVGSNREAEKKRGAEAAIL